MTVVSVIFTKEKWNLHRAKYEKSMRVRRKVLGDEYVDNALEAASDFTGLLGDLLFSKAF